MTWKVSKKQAKLKQQLEDSLKVYNRTSTELDQMLLKMLHRNGVYTPDDFHQKYMIKRTRSVRKQQAPHVNTSKNSKLQKPMMGEALIDLSSALNRLNIAVKRGSHSHHYKK